MFRTYLALTCFSIIVCSSFQAVLSEEAKPKDAKPTPTLNEPAPSNSHDSVETVHTWDSTHNSSVANDSEILRAEANVFHRFGLDTGAVKRTFYVVAAVTGVVLLYFTFKGIRTMRRRRRKPRRYGLLADSKEMKQFRDEEEEDSDLGEEDATLFDARKHKATNKRGP